MKASFALISAYTAVLCLAPVAALTISEINGNRFLSPYRDQAVTNVTGLITAKGPDGIWIRSTAPDSDDSTSESIYVFNETIGSNHAVGDIIRLDGTVIEYRARGFPPNLYLTEIIAPRNVRRVSTGNRVDPAIIGVSTLDPPTEQFTSLDNGDVFGLPNNASRISARNPILQPRRYGLDFWESLSGELVTVRNPRAVSKPHSRFRSTWIVGHWPSTGSNRRGGLTMTDRDGNPEAILVGDPLDGSRNPRNIKLGDDLEDITGIITQEFGFYHILPLTNLKIIRSAQPALPPPTTLVSDGDCGGLTFGVYNVENLTPTSSHLSRIAGHIVDYLKTPNLMFLQEIQDNNGQRNDDVVDANSTLRNLVDAIRGLSNVSYDFVDIDPIDDQDGGQGGGNIRVAYLYDPTVIRLRNPHPGSSRDANEVLPGPELRFNPGLIDPLNTAAWTRSRKPLAAAWETLDGRNSFFTINVHFSSKNNGTSIEGDPRPPVNNAVNNRLNQAVATANFIAAILQEDPNAAVISAGDFNEFAFAAPLRVFSSISKLYNLDDIAGVDELERYTYIFDMNCQQLDHMYVSEALTWRGASFEHLHVNTWSNASAAVTDHDPSVARLNVCRR